MLHRFGRRFRVVAICLALSFAMVPFPLVTALSPLTPHHASRFEAGAAALTFDLTRVLGSKTEAVGLAFGFVPNDQSLSAGCNSEGCPVLTLERITIDPAKESPWRTANGYEFFYIFADERNLQASAEPASGLQKAPFGMSVTAGTLYTIANNGASEAQLWRLGMFSAGVELGETEMSQQVRAQRFFRYEIGPQAMPALEAVAFFAEVRFNGSQIPSQGLLAIIPMDDALAVTWRSDDGADTTDVVEPGGCALVTTGTRFSVESAGGGDGSAVVVGVVPRDVAGVTNGAHPTDIRQPAAIPDATNGCTEIGSGLIAAE